MNVKIGIVGWVAILLLGGCLPSAKDDRQILQETEERVEETVKIPEVQLKKEYYRTLLPFKKSASRGLVVNNIYSKYDIREAEEGLLRLSTNYFDPSNYYFQEGQYIDKKTARKWLSRSSTDDKGLNPPIAEGMSDEQIAQDAPIYLAHIIEQNYLVMTEEKKVRLAGISIGLAMNSIYYPRGGNEIEIPARKMEEEGMKMAEEIVKRLREKEGLAEIPIVVGLFKQQSRNSITPGTYFASAVANEGKSAPTGWKEIHEQYVTLPAPSSVDNYRDLNTKFGNFKQDIDDYITSFVDVIGTAFLKDQKLQSLSIEMPIQFFGTSEVIGLTQYVTALVETYYPNIAVEVSITSVNGPEALIVKEAGDKPPFVHIYGY